MTDTKLSDELHAALSKPRPTARAAATIHANYWARLHPAQLVLEERTYPCNDGVIKSEVRIVPVDDAVSRAYEAGLKQGREARTADRLALRARRAVDEWLRGDVLDPPRKLRVTDTRIHVLETVVYDDGGFGPDSIVATGTNHIELADALGLEWRGE